MIRLNVALIGDGVLSDVNTEDIVTVSDDITIAVLDKGMKSGKPSVGILIKLPDGKTLLAQTSAKLFVSAANAIHAKYPDLLKEFH